MENQKLGTLYGVSVGPGDPELMTLKAVRIIDACPVVALPRSGKENETVALNIARKNLADLDKKELLTLDLPMTRDPEELRHSREAAAEKIIEALQMGRDVAFLTLGDVSVYSTYSYLHAIVEKRGFLAEMVAGVPSFCAAAARLGEALAKASQPLHVIPASYEGAEEALGWRGTKVLMKTGRSLEKVKGLLRDRGLYEGAKMVSRCGMEGEQVFHSLDEADERAGYFCVILVRDGEEEGE